MAPAATRAVVSRADARSRMSRASSRSYLRRPVRSAWPGRRRRHLALAALGGILSARGAGSMISGQFFQSRFGMTIAIGEPMVSPARTPDRNSTCVLLDLHAAAAAVALLAADELCVTSSASSGSPAGQPFKNGDQGLAVAFAGGGEADGQASNPSLVIGIWFSANCRPPSHPNCHPSSAIQSKRARRIRRARST